MRPCINSAIPSARELAAIVWILALASLAFCHAAPAATWAKDAVSLDVPCPEHLLDPAPRSRSPDGSVAIVELCRNLTPDGVETTVLRVTLGDGTVQDIVPEIPGTIWRPEEILWSPDSKAFIVNGGENAYAGYSFILYEISGKRVVASRPTRNAQRDMARLFPPCRALNSRADICKKIATAPEFNLSVIRWAHGSDSVIVFGEVPCSSTYGGIMCQVVGYELEARTGRILRRISARELKQRYQSSMGWDMEIPDPPVYR